MIVYGMSGCICTKLGGTAEAIAFVPVELLRQGLFLYPKCLSTIKPENLY